VVGFNVGGNPDLIVDGKSGFIAKNGDASEIVRMIEKIYFEGESLRKSARSFGLKGFSESQIVSSYQALYEDVLRKQSLS
jgi:glycosyltransferase involved in cell wall biosynthesis